MSEIEIGSIDSWSISSEWSKEVTGEDLVRVNETLWEARKYRGKIGSSVASNSKIAAFIKFLIIEISYELFWNHLGCFRIDGGVGDQQFLSKLFVSCMLPLYETQADTYGLQNEFELDYHFLVTFDSYLLYVQNAITVDPNGRKMNEKKLIRFLEVVVSHWSITSQEWLNLTDSIQQRIERKNS